MRLIDADKLIEVMKNDEAFNPYALDFIIENIENAPTAYDMNKVVKEHFAKIMSFINTSNRGNSDYFIVDQIENYIAEQLKEI